MEDRNIYAYDGPVHMFGTCVNSKWSGETTAPTERKARSNLIYQYKKQTKRSADSRVTLPGKLRKIS